MRKKKDSTTMARRVRREPDGTWGANVWVPGMRRRNHYRTRREAEQASISDENVLYCSPFIWSIFGPAEVGR